MPAKSARSRRFRELVGLWTDLFREHELLTFATAIAFRALVAAVALLLLGFGLLGAFGREDVWESQIGPAVQAKVTVGVFAGINGTVERIFAHDSAGLIVFAAALAIWEVSSLVRACMNALTRVYGMDDERPWWIRFPISFGIAVVLTAAIVGAVLLMTAAKGAFGGAWHIPWFVARWLGAVVAIGLGFGFLVRWAPAERRAERWVSAGTTLVVVGWIVESLIFSWYVSSLANFKTAIGTLTAVYVLTTYLYIAGIILLVAMQLDELLRRDVQGEERGIIELVRGLF